MAQKSKPPVRQPSLASLPDEFDEERIPFDEVMRKLANTKPPHKAPKAPTKPAKK